MNTELTIVKDLMSKHNLTKKDLFSFCICAVNFLEYYMEECMGDMMMGCPERYYGCDSNDTRKVAGALTAEKKSEKWTDEDQFVHYMTSIQEIILDDFKNKDLGHFFREYERFGKVYRREVMIPVMLGCPVEDYDDTKFSDRKYLESIINEDGLTMQKAKKERHAAEMKAFLEKQEAELKREVEERKNDPDFSILFASCIDITDMKGAFEAYNQKYYPDKGYKIIPVQNPQMLIIQTGAKTLEDAKNNILAIAKRRVMIVGHETLEKLIPVEEAFPNIPQSLTDNKVTHVVTYF